MILYISAGTSNSIYDDAYHKKLIFDGTFQVQKFNNNVIMGLSEYEKIVALSILPYKKINIPEIVYKTKNIEFICAKNTKGKLRKIYRVKELIKLGKKIIKQERPRCIICDSITLAASYAAIKLGKKYSIPTIAIVTDVPEKYCSGKIGFSGKLDAKLMKKYDKYILLTEQMNEIVNPKNRPSMVMEGACGEVPTLIINKKRIILYTGSLWKNNLGLEYFTEGFIKAKLKDVELHFYGVGEFQKDIEEYSKQNESIKYMGTVSNSEIIKKQAESSLLINPRPSTEEYCKYSFPSKTFEYMSSGSPVLMTKLPGIPKEYFDYVFVIEREDSDYVAKKLNEIFSLDEETRNSFGIKAREFIEKNKNYKKQSKRIFDFI